MRTIVGRDRELGVLDELLRRAELGDRPIVMITGEPGIGKSSLLAALADRVVTLSGKVAWGRTYEVGSTPAFWPWLQVLSALAADDDPAPALGLLDEHAVATTRLARFAEVASFLARRALHPTALLFDDLHACDRSSLQLLEHVIPALARSKLLIAFTARDGDAPPEVAAALGRLQRHAKRLQLGRLTRDDVAQLVEGRADADRVFTLSEGNPLFVTELVASLDADGVARLPTLSGVRTVIHQRISKLPEPVARALVAGAVIGREFATHHVADMLGEPPALAPAVALGMISACGADRYRFSHVLVAETIVDDLEPSRRSQLHLRAARALANHDIRAVAHHLLAAGGLAIEAAVVAAERAARDALARLAFEDAAGLAERARALISPDALSERVRLAILHAEALQHAGDHGKANTVCAEAMGLARQLGDGNLVARVALVRGLEFRFGTTDHALVEMLREALERLAPDPSPLRARLLARLAAALQPAPDPHEPVTQAWAAIAMARELESERERLDTIYIASAALVDYVEPTTLAPLHREVLELARRAGDSVIVVHTTLRQCWMALELVDRERFEDEARAFTQLATELAIPRWLRMVPLLESLSAVLDSRWDDHARAVATAQQLAAGDPHASFLISLHQLLSATVRTDPITATHDDFAPLIAGRRPASAWFAAVSGDLDTARTHVAALGDEPIDDANMCVLAVEAICLVGDTRAARARYQQLIDRSGHIVVASMVGCCVQDLFDRLLLVLANASERWDAIDQHADRALAVAIRLASPVWAAKVRADYATALARRDWPGDQARARELWTQVRADAVRFAMPGLLARCTGVPVATATESRDEPRTAPRAAISLSRAGELWIIESGGERHHVRNSRGMQMLARLIAEPGRELHVLDLVGASEPVDAGDPGPLLDGTARAQYRARIGALTEQRDRAEAMGDHDRALRADAELSALTTELARAFGLGGRARKAGSAAERARTNVQRRLQHALQQIHAASPRLGVMLEAAVRTGMTCVYTPALT